ncbi:tubulin-specific chaperone E [Klebsormidium nitens]|uniref:Tubulin-specific chaperone E n=1 Tax=Klebsormidium nitens TaxID=105231 RepID=A0A1Y1HVZ8_KLENI|nr:tubulin-specific chaperone E [Klebsormidium nitens]|eukprot:GAQ82810.1 tubulin-specific chaperone E [Klebsormidium nitens]
MMTSSSLESPFQVGQRIRSSDADGFKGTVRYVGPVAGQQGTWIGIEWDDLERGKHDGEAGGVKYFHVEQPGAGSLVRSHKIQAGITLVQALRARYKPSEEAERTEDSKEMYIMSVRNRPMPVVLVGLDKIQQEQGRLERLQQAALIDAGVDSAGQPGEIGATAKNIEELDLTGNLLHSWTVIGQIVSELPKLRVLNLSRNRLTASLDNLATSSTAPVFSGLTTLVLNNSGITWASVTALGPSLSSIRELHLCGNGIQDFGTGPIENLPSLELLDLEDNKIRRWEDVLKLSALRSLTSLFLSGNELTDVRYLQASEAHGAPSGNLPFQGLQCLLLGRNQLSEWASIDSLDRFPSLQEVRLTDNPLTDARGGTAARYMLIARIGGLTCLNGSNISARERRDSEVRYVRHVIAQQLEGKEDSEHPRFEALKAKYGLVMEDLTGGPATQKSLADELCSLSLTCVAPGAGERAPIVKKLPASTTVARLRVFCEKLFRVKADRQRLFFTTEDSPHPTSIDSDEDTLGSLGFVSSATILIDEVDAASIRQEQAAAQADHERRLQQQLKQVELFTSLQKAEVEQEKRTVAGRRVP